MVTSLRRLTSNICQGVASVASPRQLSTSKDFAAHTAAHSAASTASTTLHNASPRLPLLYYRASTRAMESMNHRVFYANWIFVFAVYDIFTAYVDF
ncbi:uncharacterized protein BcabD6B2_36870 [Babesia caballi]|uniref:Uncharacterized protein n=1 Tax=Babesia caballi TaxID=5871 RepID=A0AAV4LVK1_BABCB|nr:hypothetical protein, conserved [Babesia caballi]